VKGRRLYEIDISERKMIMYLSERQAVIVMCINKKMVGYINRI
jgi:hypothetical protein